MGDEAAVTRTTAGMVLLRRCGMVWYDKKHGDWLPTVRTCRRWTLRSSDSCRRCADALKELPTRDRRASR